MAKGIKSSNQYIMKDSLGDIDILKENTIFDKYAILSKDKDHIPNFYFSKKNKVLSRTDTNGYQLKGITHNRRYFVKSQAIISGVALRDYLVEIIASNICNQLSIPCVQQRQCSFVYKAMMEFILRILN